MIQIFATGGTFDKEYNLISGTLFFKDSHLARLLKRGRCTVEFDIKTLMMIDSNDMETEERDLIVYQCKKANSDKIVITHGTDTMVETARVLAKAKIPKTIIITGAMIPYAFGTSSDGFFNLGSAIALVQTLKEGVYVAMNGRFFDWDNVVKNKQTGFFESID